MWGPCRGEAGTGGVEAREWETLWGEGGGEGPVPTQPGLPSSAVPWKQEPVEGQPEKRERKQTESEKSLELQALGLFGLADHLLGHSQLLCRQIPATLATRAHTHTHTHTHSPAQTHTRMHRRTARERRAGGQVLGRRTSAAPSSWGASLPTQPRCTAAQPLAAITVTPTRRLLLLSSKPFTWMNLFKPHSNPSRWALSSAPVCRWESGLGAAGPGARCPSLSLRALGPGSVPGPGISTFTAPPPLSTPRDQQHDAALFSGPGKGSHREWRAQGWMPLHPAERRDRGSGSDKLSRHT